MSKNPFADRPEPATSANPFDDAYARIQDELDRKEPMGMANDGWDALETASADYMASVGVLAIRYAEVEGLPDVHKKHIGDASAFIGSRPRATLSIFVTSTLGGMFAGVGGGTLGSIYADTPAPVATDPLYVLSLLMSVIGLALVISSIAITIVSRRR